ncbi:FGGY family carbohydrate kinase [Mycoplasma suis]|uniref:Glycerol kinase n=1 Tax=Mycoplasma suis (strain Illinois) TaxID=768700 RepID=F0QQR2_MYCSL|nr:FGGY family carbohydrate kinase [Mycoplasma suis]ADX97832.1 Glycerol kinase [Mycoplasma suis str. Illinois]
MTGEDIVLSIDLGSTALKLILFSSTRKQILCEEHPFGTYFPKEGWVEHDGEEIWGVLEKSLSKLLDSLKKEDYPSFLSISTQRESVLLWTIGEGKSLSPIISWQDNRTEKFINDLDNRERDFIRERTGLWITTYSSATKLNYLVKEICEKMKGQDYLMGTLESWLIYKLTKGQHFVSDYSSASRTALLNLKTLEWDLELCDFFDVPIDKLPKLIENDREITGVKVGNHNLSIKGVVGDQQGALYFAKKVSEVNSSLVYGTGAFLLNLTSEELDFQDLLDSFKGENSPLITLAWKKVNELPRFALEWSFSNCGQSLEWLRKHINYKDLSALNNLNLEQFNLLNCPLCLPFFSGKWLLSSRESWNSSFYSISSQSKSEDWIISYFEGLAFSIRAVLEEAGIKESENILVGGGLTRNNLFSAIQSNGLGRSLIISQWIQLSGIGVALFALQNIPKCDTKEVSIDQNKSPLFKFRYKQWSKLSWQNEKFRNSNNLWEKIILKNDYC